MIADRKSCGYSLCGRTDKGVSALGNVISLYLRARPDHKDGDYNYAKIINRNLPDDIRIISYKIVPHHFDARFSCLYREYKYFFVAADLDFEKMQLGCNYFVGIHNFKNFCKEDPGKRKSTERRILSCNIERKGIIGEICIRGYSFLWHQVRCMVAILFRIGMHTEEPEIIQEMLTNLNFKPQYEIASETGLILHDCCFETMKFDSNIDDEENSRRLSTIYKELLVKLEIVNCIFINFNKDL